MLLTLRSSMTQIHPYIDAVRRDAYKDPVQENNQSAVLDQMFTAIRGVDIAWQTVEAGSPLICKSLKEANIRSNVGASVIALIRNNEVIPNPKSTTQFDRGDLVGLIGDDQELQAAAGLVNPGRD